MSSAGKVTMQRLQKNVKCAQKYYIAKVEDPFNNLTRHKLLATHYDFVATHPNSDPRIHLKILSAALRVDAYYLYYLSLLIDYILQTINFGLHICTTKQILD